jgi:hypothetical protein
MFLGLDLSLGLLKLRTSFRVLGAVFIPLICLASPSRGDERPGQSLPNFVSSSGFERFAEAVQETETENRTRLAASTISEMFSKTDRPDSQLVAVTEKRDLGPTLSLTAQSTAQPIVSSVDLPAVTVSQIAERPHRAKGIRAEIRRPKTLLRVAELQKISTLREEAVEPGIEHDPEPGLPSSSMQSMLSRCGKMTPECLANRAWCGC